MVYTVRRPKLRRARVQTTPLRQVPELILCISVVLVYFPGQMKQIFFEFGPPDNGAWALHLYRLAAPYASIRIVVHAPLGVHLSQLPQFLFIGSSIFHLHIHDFDAFFRTRVGTLWPAESHVHLFRGYYRRIPLPLTVISVVLLFPLAHCPALCDLPRLFSLKISQVQGSFSHSFRQLPSSRCDAQLEVVLLFDVVQRVLHRVVVLACFGVACQVALHPAHRNSAR